MRNTQVACRVSDFDRKRLQEFAEILDISEAQILREGLRERLNQLELDPRVARLRAQKRMPEVAVVYE